MKKNKDIFKIDYEGFEKIWKDSIAANERNTEERKNKDIENKSDIYSKLNFKSYPGDKIFDKFLGELGLSINPIMIRALFRDRIESGDEAAFRNLFKVILPENNIFKDKKEFEIFLCYFMSLWNHLCSEYETGKRKKIERTKILRRKCIDILLSNTNFIRGLDKNNHKPQDLPPRLMKRLMEADGIIQGILTMIEDKPRTADSPETDETLNHLDMMTISIDEIKRDIREYLQKNGGKVNNDDLQRTGLKKRDEFLKVYQFKITLMGIKPEIWREIQVPETYTFWDLHIAIQDSMGWMDSHLHEFTLKAPDKGKEIYFGIPVDEDEDDPRQILPDWEYRIADYIEEYNKEFLYVYDFGDDWQHMVTFEGIQVREKGIKYPLCLDGARACPPEDVGSTGGYENFLNIINNSDHEEYKETMEWASSQIDVKNECQPCKKGDRVRNFAPEHFDIEEIVFDDPAERIKNLSEDGQ